MLELRSILARHDPNPDLWRVDADEAISRLAELLACGHLQACGKRKKTDRANPDERPGGQERTAVARVVKGLKSKNTDFTFEGRSLRIVSTVEWKDMKDGDVDYQILPKEDAQQVLKKLGAAPSTPHAEKVTLEAAAPLVTDTRRGPLDQGLLLLRKVPRRSGGVGTARAPVISVSQLRKELEVKHWVQFKVVDEITGRPINGVRLRVETPDGNEASHTTAGKGTVRIEDIPAGNCIVKCELKKPALATTRELVAVGGAPAVEPGPDSDKPLSGTGLVIADVEEHEVATGESIKSLATDAGLTWQELAKFNWETDEPKKINQYLRDYVGCTQKTRDGKNYMFDDSDEPGILYIPRPWIAAGLATESEHVIRVKALEDFRVILETTDGEHRLPDVQAKVKLADGKSRSVKLGKGGVARIKDPPPGKVEVQYEDQDDIKAKALAANARTAFDKRATEEMYRILKHSPVIVARTVAAYDQYFNTLHGKGLVNDLYAEFVDPKALRVVVGLLARAGIETREKAVFVPLGSGGGDHIVYAAPELRAVIPNAEISYTCSLKAAVLDAPGAGNEYEWYCFNDRASIERDGGAQIFFGPKKAYWDKAKWTVIGDHAVVCRVQHRSSSGQLGTPYYYEYPQAVEKAEAIVARHLGGMKSKETPDPHQMLSASGRMLETWKAAEEYAKKDDPKAGKKAFPPLPREEQEEYDARKSQLETFVGKLNERVGGKHLQRKHFPIRAVYLDENGSDTTMRVCLRHKVPEPGGYQPGIDNPTWELVDWTHPAVRTATGVYEGTGKNYTAAVKDALATWDSGFRGNRYPKGQIGYEVPGGFLDEQLSGRFTTSGSSALDDIAKWLGYVGAAAGIVALCLAPEPAASKAAAAALYVAIFAGTASAVINIGQRYDEGFSNWREDGLDSLTIVSNCFGLAWMRGAQLSYAGKTYILVGRVAADAGQGIFLAMDTYDAYDGIMQDPRLSPDERAEKLLKLFGQIAGTSAMMYLNFKGTKADIQSLKGAGKTQIKIEDLGDKSKTITIKDELPALEGHTNDKTKKTKIGTEITREPITAAKEPPTFKDEFPPDDKFWRINKVSDTDIVLQHPRAGYEAIPQADWAFHASWKNGTVKITIRSVEKDAAGKVIGGSKWPDGKKCLVAEDLYAMMFKHFEKAGLQIKAWEGPFAWDNYQSVRKAMIGPPPLSAEDALMKGITAEKYWVPWAKSKGLKPKVVYAFDDNDGWFNFRVEFVPE